MESSRNPSVVHKTVRYEAGHCSHYIVTIIESDCCKRCVNRILHL